MHVKPDDDSLTGALKDVEKLTQLKSVVALQEAVR